MNDDFDQLSQAVMDHIIQIGRGRETKRAYQRCFKSLGNYLREKEVSYSNESASLWLSSVNVKKTEHDLYYAAVNKLNDLYLFGEIRKGHYDPSKTKAGKLYPEFRSLLEGIRCSLSPKADETIDRHIRQCTSILLRFQNNGIKSILEIRYEDLLVELNSSSDKTYYSRCSHHASLRLLLQYLYDQDLAPYGFTLFVDAMSLRTGNYWSNVSKEQLENLKDSMKDPSVPLDSYLNMRDELYNIHSQENYSKTALRGLLRITNLFYLFMEMNDLCYSPAIGQVWLDSLESHLPVIEYKHARRIICLLEKQFENEVLRLHSSFVFRKTVYSRLPDWCRQHVDTFLQLKKCEGWAPSTMNMYRSSICRFCISIDQMGVKAFGTLNVSDVKRFNLDDHHSTPAGKNAYNSRIRKFLQYLCENQITNNPFLFLALPCVCAAKETLVITLTEEEQETLRNIFNENDTTISLREKAMIQLGLYMGIRATDIASLTIDDIDWDNAVIRVIQDKTDYEIDLPMPIPVANALYRYIMNERPGATSRSIFIRKHAPFAQVGKGACLNALNKALPERDVKGSGFHVTRKTYATNLLINDVPAQDVAEILGQRGLATVHKYLSLEECRMRLCGLSLSDKGLPMKGGFCHE